jgi:hypothetical protein
MADIVSDTNAKIVGAVTGVNIMSAVSWIVFGLIIIGAAIWGYIYWRDKKLFNKKITVFDIVGINFVPAMRDVAKVVKIGSGGFEILYLKKLKIYRIAYGGRVGKDTYYFFILPDGYWFNGMLSANMMMIDKDGGLIPVVTTNPTMRSQYTSLEKQIDSLKAAKTSIWDKYGSWILSIAFVLVSGVMLWLSYKEYATTMGNLASVVDKVGLLIDKVGTLQGGTNPTGLVKVG